MLTWGVVVPVCYRFDVRRHNVLPPSSAGRRLAPVAVAHRAPSALPLRRFRDPPAADGLPTTRGLRVCCALLAVTGARFERGGKRHRVVQRFAALPLANGSSCAPTTYGMLAVPRRWHAARPFRHDLFRLDAPTAYAACGACRTAVPSFRTFRHTLNDVPLDACVARLARAYA